MEISPPLGLIGTFPSTRVSPSATANPPRPLGKNPRSSLSTISAIVKQSCNSTTSTSAGTIPAMANAFLPAITVASRVTGFGVS